MFLWHRPVHGAQAPHKDFCTQWSLEVEHVVVGNHMEGKGQGYMDLGGQHKGHRGQDVREPLEEGCESLILTLLGQHTRQWGEISRENHHY